MAGAMGVAALLGTTGCQEGRDEQIRALQARLDGLEGENADLKNRLNACNQDADNAKQRALQLQNLLDDCKRQLAMAPSMPAPQPSDGWTQQGAYAWKPIEEDILFDSGKAALKSSGKQALQKIASELRTKFPGKIYMVIGNTDTDPIVKSAKNWEDNMDLSLGRGRVVANELIALGIDPKSLIAGGQGEHNPRGPNDTKANKEKNRRVTVIAVDPPPGRTSIAGVDAPVMDSTGEVVAVTMR
jgi:flagellar motor protein MotB